LHQTGLGTDVSATEIDLPSVNAGQLQLVRVTSATATQLQISPALTEQFTVPGAQAVLVPEYTSIDVPGGTTVTASPWDGTAGGIVAFLATGAVNVNGDVTASGQGFRGGLFASDSTQETGCWSLSEPAPTGAPKGEGIVILRYGWSSAGLGVIGNAG